MRPGRRSALLAAALLALVLARPAGALETLRPGMTAPAFTLETFDGRPLGSQELATARVVLVAFWASWSEKSSEALARLQALHVAHAGRGLAVVGINVDSPGTTPEDRGRARALAQKLGVTFPLLVDRGLATFSAYGVVAVPSMVALRGDRTILADLASYPLAGREEFFDIVEAAVLGTETKRVVATGPVSNSRAFRYFNLARVLAARGHVGEAEEDFKRAIALDETFAAPRALLGQLYRERALAVDAVRFAGQSIATTRVAPGDRARWLADAERLLGEAIRLDAANVLALTELAAVHAARRGPGAARELLDRALRVNASYAPARAHLGALLLRDGDVERGRAELEAAARLDPLDWRLSLVAAQAYDERGMAADAARHYRRGAELLWQARREPLSLAPPAQ